LEGAQQEVIRIFSKIIEKMSGKRGEVGMKIKQIVVPEAHRVELQVTDVDALIDDNEILIETEATFISSGTELAIFQANTQRVYQPGAWCAYPWKAGYAHVGIVREIGRDVTRFNPGQRVFSHGNHASAVIVDQDGLVVPVPEGMDPGIAAATRLASISDTSIHVADIAPGSWVAVYGLGFVGNMAAQIFQLMGCKVIGIDPNGSRRSLAEECGICYTVGGSEAEAAERIREITQGDMCHISVDAVGHSKVVAQAMKSTAKFGQVILLGTPRVPVEGNLTDLLADIHLRWLTVRGALNFHDQDKLLEIQKNTFHWVRSGKLNLEPLISHRLRPEQIEEAYFGLLNKQEEYTGVILLWKD
jgi:2-desacetyl-2-hydroxyethyl bacteriochlorophyllide A dehydrogenase